MLFWVICAVLTVAATVYALRPVLTAASADAGPEDNPDLRVYKEQLGEVDRDIARGLLTPEEGEAARIEISRRILALEPGVGDREERGTPARQSMVFYATSAAIVVSTLGLYLTLGSPGYPGQPFAERLARPASDAPVQELIARVEARLREEPGDGQGWDVLAPVYLKQGRNQDAVRAFGRAIALLGENQARLRGLAEAHLAASNGIVGKPVRDAFRKMLAADPGLIAPRFWLAVGLEQDGKRTAAAAAYRALIENEAGDKKPLPTPIKKLVEQRLAVVTGATKGPTAELPKTGERQVARPRPLPEAGKGPALPPGMSAPKSAKDRAAMIEQMVSGLDDRLKENGGSLQEWQRLIRAYTVLGRREKATGALSRAKKQFANDAATGQKLDSFARQLGINPG